VITTVAGAFTDWLLISFQISASGFQVWAASCSGVRVGGTYPRSVVSISPTLGF
jgi:hypothetical protein